MATTPPDPKEGSGPKEEYIAGISRTPSPPLLAMDVTPGTQGSFTFSPPPKPGPINPAPQDRAQQELIGDAQLRLDGVFCTISDRLQYLTLAHHLVCSAVRHPSAVGTGSRSAHIRDNISLHSHPRTSPQHSHLASQQRYPRGARHLSPVLSLLDSPRWSLPHSRRDNQARLQRSQRGNHRASPRWCQHPSPRLGPV